MTDKYEPLDPAELAAAGVHPERLVWTPIVPIPDGEKPPWSLIRRLCPRGHKLLTAWPYRTPSGCVSSIVARYNKTGTDKKTFKPFAYCRNGAGAPEWQSVALPEPRPLFNLDQLAGRPDAPVLVVEGEGKAGPAARIFPDRVSTTSPGGAGAFGKADWTPLAGRDVVIWPDHDKSGATYARGVAEAALKSGARSVRIVQVPAHFENKWDLAKSAPTGADLRQLLDSATPFRAGNGDGTKDSPIPPCDMAEDSAEGVESSKTGEDPARAKHDRNSDKETYLRLSKLSTGDYERVRAKEAKALGDDFRVTMLDKEVEALRPKGADGGMQGRAMSFPEVEPWPEAVDGAALLDELSAQPCRHGNPERRRNSAMGGAHVHTSIFRPGWEFFPQSHGVAKPR